MIESILLILGVLLLAVTLLGLLLWFNTDHPVEGMDVPVYSLPDAPLLQRGQLVKVMTYNVQFFAGKNYVFFFDLPDFSGPDTRPSARDVEVTMKGIARVIAEELPDIILLQEVDEGAKRTDYKDQLALLLSRLPPEYRCQTSTFYWRLRFAPHPKILGATGMKTTIISRYRMARAIHHNLPSLPVNFFLKQLTGNRVVLKAFFPCDDGTELAVMSTHLDAFTIGSDIMDRQIDRLESLFSELDERQIPWILGGDLNLLLPGQYERLIETERGYYNPKTELGRLLERYQMIPSLKDGAGDNAANWYTYFGNDPRLAAPDRTLDYIVYSSTLNLIDGHVRHADTARLSDHYPVVATIQL